MELKELDQRFTAFFMGDGVSRKGAKEENRVLKMYDGQNRVVFAL